MSEQVKSKLSIARTKHGHAKPMTPTYKTWRSMKYRVNDPGYHNSRLYIGKGIKICDRWQKFENFLEDMGERPEGCTLDRWPNKEGDYEPGNCRWATPREQARNTSRNVLDFEKAVPMTDQEILDAAEAIKAKRVETAVKNTLSRVGSKCSQCGGVMGTDHNGYHLFNRCQSCSYVPMFMQDGSEFPPPPGIVGKDGA